MLFLNSRDLCVLLRGLTWGRAGGGGGGGGREVIIIYHVTTKYTPGRWSWSIVVGVCAVVVVAVTVVSVLIAVANKSELNKECAVDLTWSK